MPSGMSRGVKRKVSFPDQGSLAGSAGGAGGGGGSARTPGPPLRKRWAEGFGNGLGSVYLGVAPRANLFTRKIAYPTTTLDGHGNVQFVIKAAHNELIKFPDDPLQMTVIVYTTNTARQQGANGWQGMTDILVDPKNSDPPCWINPILQGSTFIADMKVSLNSIKTDEPQGISSLPLVHSLSIIFLMTFSNSF